MRVLTWNLYHGRARPNAGRSLLYEFTAAIAGWDWDVALLQEVPPWWPPALARSTGAHAHRALTSRNFGMWLRRAISSRNPDLLKANGGGSNGILVRGEPGGDHHKALLCRLPERRVAHGVSVGGTRVVNLHASLAAPERTQRDLRRAQAAADEWSGGGPLIIGGDFNMVRPSLPGLDVVASHWVDHVAVRGWKADGPAQVLDARPLSDHRPLLVALARA